MSNADGGGGGYPDIGGRVSPCVKYIYIYMYLKAP